MSINPKLVQKRSEIECKRIKLEMIDKYTSDKIELRDKMADKN